MAVVLSGSVLVFVVTTAVGITPEELEDPDETLLDELAELLIVVVITVVDGLTTTPVDVVEPFGAVLVLVETIMDVEVVVMTVGLVWPSLPELEDD